MSEGAKLTAAGVRMFGAYVLIQRDKPQERKSPGGIVLPVQAAQHQSWATVVAVGTEAQAALRPGDRILVGQFAGVDVRIDEETCVVVRLEDVMGVAASHG